MTFFHRFGFPVENCRSSILPIFSLCRHVSVSCIIFIAFLFTSLLPLVAESSLLPRCYTPPQCCEPKTDNRSFRRFLKGFSRLKSDFFLGFRLPKKNETETPTRFFLSIFPLVPYANNGYIRPVWKPRYVWKHGHATQSTQHTAQASPWPYCSGMRGGGGWLHRVAVGSAVWQSTEIGGITAQVEL